MSRRLSSSVLLCVCVLFVKAQFPDLSNYQVTRDGATNFSCTRGGDAGEMSKTEVPPWIVGGGNDYKSYFLTDGQNSGIFSIQQSIDSNTNIDPAHGTGPFWTSFSG